MKERITNHICLLFGLMLSAAALRFFHISQQSLWLDEITSLAIAKKDIFSIISGSGFDRHTPPFYYLLLHFWIKLFGTSETSLRLPSLIFDVLNVALIARVFSAAGDRRLGLSASLLYAVSPFAIYYSQEARMYTLLVLQVLATFYGALLFLDNKLTKLKTAILALIMITGMYTHYYFALALSAITLAILWEHRRKLSSSSPWLVLLLITAITFLPWLPKIFALANSEGQTFRRFHWLILPYTLFRFVAGYALIPINLGVKEDLLGTLSKNLLQLAAVTGVVILHGVAILKSFKTPPSRLTRVAACALIVPYLLASLISFKMPILSERYLIVTLPFIIYFLAQPFAFKKQFIPFVSCCLFLLMASYAVAAQYFSPAFGKTPWKQVAASIQTVSKEGVVLVSPHYACEVIKYYLPSSISVQPLLSTDPHLTQSTFATGTWLIAEVNSPSVLKQLSPFIAQYQFTLQGTFVQGNGLLAYQKIQ